jgi:tetratricopeptide (TPR) repeat protein
VLKRYPTASACLLLVGLTWAIYWQVAGFEFVAFDDDSLVYRHPVIREGLSRESLAWAFTSIVWANWTPLAWLSHMLDVEMFGLDPGGHHLTSASLHVVNTLLLFGLLRSLTGAVWRSALVAALFAVHPLHVESVAWISERRDVLSTAFGLLSLWSYSSWARGGGWRAYAAAFVFAALGLMSKPMLVTLPILFLLIDYWPLGRMRLGSGSHGGAAAVAASPRRSFATLLIEKAPFFALVAGTSAVAVLSQSSGGSVPSSAALPLEPRVANALISYVAYLGKTIWPTGLAVFYPHPNLPGGPEPWTALDALPAALFLAVLSLALLWYRRHGYALVGWLWYLITLVPVIGFIQVGEHAMADRYTYLPLIGIFVAFAWGAGELVARQRGRRPWLQAVAVGSTVALVVAAAAVSWRQIGYWRDSITLFSHAIEVTQGNFRMHFNLANTYKGRGEIAQALWHYEQAVTISPRMYRAHFNLANTLRSEGRLDEAIEHYELAAWDLSHERALRGLVAASVEKDGTRDALVGFFLRAAERFPGSPEVRVMLGHALRLEGRLDAAIEAYRHALEIDPEDEMARRSLDEALEARAASR